MCFYSVTHTYTLYLSSLSKHESAAVRDFWPAYCNRWTTVSTHNTVTQTLASSCAATHYSFFWQNDLPHEIGRETLLCVSLGSRLLMLCEQLDLFTVSIPMED